MQKEKQMHRQHIQILQFAFKFKPVKGLLLEIHQQQQIQTHQASLKSSSVQFSRFFPEKLEGCYQSKYSLNYRSSKSSYNQSILRQI